MTHRIYLASDQAECLTTITGTGWDNNGAWVVVDETILCPRSGGQESDRGSIDGTQVMKVGQFDETVFHYLDDSDDAESFRVGQTVRLKLDQKWRNLISRLHNAGHLIAGSVGTTFPGLREVLSRHFLGEAFLDFEGDDLPSCSNVRENLNRKLPDAIADDLPVRIVGNPFVLRVIQIADFPPTPCLGTHPKSTGAIGAIKIRGVRMLGRRLRVSYNVEPDVVIAAAAPDQKDYK